MAEPPPSPTPAPELGEVVEVEEVVEVGEGEEVEDKLPPLPPPPPPPAPAAAELALGVTVASGDAVESSSPEVGDTEGEAKLVVGKAEEEGEEVGRVDREGEGAPHNSLSVTVLVALVRIV